MANVENFLHFQVGVRPAGHLGKMLASLQNGNGHGARLHQGQGNTGDVGGSWDTRGKSITKLAAAEPGAVGWDTVLDQMGNPV